VTVALPPALKLAKSLLVAIELVVADYPRKHRHLSGNSLRMAARAVVSTGNKAWMQPGRRAMLLQQLVDEVDDLKAELQLCQDLRAYKSFAQFEALARVAEQLGSQVGGWKRHLYPSGQSDAAKRQQQRPETLSTPAASRYEANQ